MAYKDGGYNKSAYAFIKLNKELLSDIYYYVFANNCNDSDKSVSSY
jgi:hypothetical protein